MKIALAQFNPTVGDFDGNSARILDLAQQAKSRGADLAVFTELCLCGYPPQDLVERPAFLERNQSELKRLAKSIPLPSIVGFVGRAQDDTGKPAANSAALIANGRILFEQRKMLLPTYDVFDESRYFQPAHSQTIIPLNGEQLGITICEDCWNDKIFWPQRLYDRDPVAELVGKGTTLLLNISASPYTMDKQGLRLDMLTSLAREHRVPVVYVNQVGGNDSLIFDGSSVAVMPDGRIAAQAKAFEEDLVLFDTATGEGDIHCQPTNELEVAYRALSLRHARLRPQMRLQQSGSRPERRHRFRAGSSDRRRCAGTRECSRSSHAGPVLLRRQLPRRQKASRKSKAIVPSPANRRSLRRLPQRPERRIPGPAGRRHRRKYPSPHPRQSTNGPLQQIRIASPEHRKQIRNVGRLLHPLRRHGRRPGGNLGRAESNGLRAGQNGEIAKGKLIPEETLTKAPSAELKPNQKDSDSLPPYDVLDRILKAYVEDLQSPEEIAELHDFPLDLVRDIARRVDRNEYKRKQAAPGLKITSKAFSVGRRFPIANRFVP